MKFCAAEIPQDIFLTVCFLNSPALFCTIKTYQFGSQQGFPITLKTIVLRDISISLFYLLYQLIRELNCCIIILVIKT